jgi:hypothetical protein
MTKWTPERRIAQGRYYQRIGRKDLAAKQWGKAGAEIKERRRRSGEDVWGFDFDIREDYNNE